ncbi:MAG: hypothetical protein KAS72_01290 [Phycisphaerales bacterium]|nr:hypothetical protein [Phycisphaerales bacterium]
MIESTLMMSVVAASLCQAAPLSHNLEVVQPWRDALADAQATESVVNTIVIGDSITINRDTWVYWTRDDLADRFGYGGEGSLDVHGVSSGDETSGWVPLPFFVQPWGRNSAWSRHFNDTSDEHRLVPTGTWVTADHKEGGWWMTFEGNQATLRYIEEAGAGTFTIKLDDQIVATIDADNGGDPQSVTYELPVPEFGTYLMDIESVELVTDPHPARIDLLDVRTGEPGSVIHRLGQGGKPCSYFLEKNEQMYQDVFATIDPDLIVIQCDPAYESIEQYELDLRELVGRFQGYSPGTPVVLISHHHFGGHIFDPTEVMYQVSLDTAGVGFVNLYDLHAERADIEQLGYLLDDVHLTAEGGHFYSDWIVRELLGYSHADLDANGVVDQADLGILLAAYGMSIGDVCFNDMADIDRDGSVGQSDLGQLLAVYGL